MFIPPKETMTKIRLVTFSGFTIALTAMMMCLPACSTPRGRIVTPNYLARYEGGGSLSTLWYQGSDNRFHHFRHLHKMSRPYRIRRGDMPWPNEFSVGSQELNKSNSLVRHEFSDFLKSQTDAE